MLRSASSCECNGYFVAGAGRTGTRQILRRGFRSIHVARDARSIRHDPGRDGSSGPSTISTRKKKKTGLSYRCFRKYGSTVIAADRSSHFYAIGKIVDKYCLLTVVTLSHLHVHGHCKLEMFNTVKGDQVFIRNDIS